MKTSVKDYVLPFCIGLYLFLCGSWMLFQTIYHSIHLVEMFTDDAFSVEYFRLTSYLIIGSMVNDVLFFVSGTMCLYACVRPVRGWFIVISGVISLAGYLRATISIFIFQQTIHTALYLMIPFLIITCGIVWEQRLSNPICYALYDGKVFPFLQEYLIYRRQRRNGRLQSEEILRMVQSYLFDNNESDTMAISTQNTDNQYAIDLVLDEVDNCLLWPDAPSGKILVVCKEMARILDDDNVLLPEQYIRKKNKQLFEIADLIIKRVDASDPRSDYVTQTARCIQQRCEAE